MSLGYFKEVARKSRPFVEKLYTSIADNERFGQGMKKVSEGGVFGY